MSKRLCKRLIVLCSVAIIVGPISVFICCTKLRLKVNLWAVILRCCVIWVAVGSEKGRLSMLCQRVVKGRLRLRSLPNGKVKEQWDVMCEWCYCWADGHGLWCFGYDAWGTYMATTPNETHLDKPQPTFTKPNALIPTWLNTLTHTLDAHLSTTLQHIHQV